MRIEIRQALSFRARMVIAVTAITLVTLGAAFAVISVVVTRTQVNHFDHALLRESQEELAEISRAAATAPHGTKQLVISDRPGPAVNDIGPLTKYGVIYDREGRVRAATPSFRTDPPPLAKLGPSMESCFDFWFHGQHLRGLLAAIPAHNGSVLLLAAPRTDLDGDAVFLRRAMELVFAVAVAWTVAVATWMVRRLTRNQRRIAEVVRRVAAGDLGARVGTLPAGGDEARLVRDIDEMIERLSNLFSAQRVFIAHAAHELRSPLTTLYGELALALRRSRSGQEYRRAIEEAFDSTRQLKGLAEDLLAVARLGASPPPSTEIVEPRSAAEHARHAVLAEGSPPGVTLEIDGESRPALVSARDLVRLFRNLFENAVRHSPPGGKVIATMSDEGATVVATVTDEGPGVAEDERGQIFAPFYRGTTVPTGTGVEAGLGLTIARGIARAYGGDVVLAAGQPSGACFRVTLPAAEASTGTLDLPAELTDTDA